MTKNHLPMLVWLCAAALVPAEVSAQLVGGDSPPPESVRRPYRGLFGGPVDPNSTQSLVLSASVFGAYDDNVAAEITGTDKLDPRLQQSGRYYGANVGLNYSLSKTLDRVTFGIASGAIANTYNVDEDRKIVPHVHLSGNLDYSITPRTTLQFNQQAVYSKYYRFQLFPTVLGPDDDGALLGDPDVELYERISLRYAVGAGIRHRLTPRSSLSGSYHFGYVDAQDAGYEDWKSQGGVIGYSRQVTTHATLNLGYGYRVSESSRPDGEPREIHDINLGMSYGRALSFSRRTSLQFSTGSAVMVSDNLTVPESDPRARFHLVGSAILTHEIGRSWTANAAYHRGLMFREGFDDPFMADGVSARIGGLITRRLDVSIAASGSLATQDRPGQNQYDSLAASAQARYALTSFLALYARYIYYQYEFGEDIPLEPGLPRSLDRQGVRVGLTTTIPLIR